MDDDEQWSPAARQRFAARVGALAEAVRRHGDAILALSGRQAEVPVLFAANDVLAAAAEAYADAQFDLTGTLPSFETYDDEGDDVDDDDAEELPPPVARLRLVRRTDFAVTDLDAVLAAGRAAYLRVWPDDTAEDAATDVDHLGRAIYQLEHAAGSAALEEIPGLAPRRSVTWVLDVSDEPEPSGALPADPAAEPIEPSPYPGRLLHQLDDYFSTGHTTSH